MTNRNPMRRSTLLAAATMALTLLVAAACGPSGGTTPPTDGDTAVQVTVDGPGRVVQGSFQCGDDCTWRGDGDAPVSFEAAPDPGYVFVAWGGDCPEVVGDSCTATFEDGDEVTATFARHALRLDLTGDGEGAFRISGGTVDTTCDADCGVALDRSLQLAVIYAAQGTTGTVLDDWAGACEGSSQANYCLVTVSGAADVGKTWRHPPVATADGYATWRNTPLAVPADEGVLADDTDTPGDPLTATVVDDVTNGTLALAADGGFEYEPDTGFEGQDGFTYRVQDAFGNDATATVTIAVVDRVPAAADDDYATTRNAPLVVAAVDGVLANDADPDGDPLTADVVDEPTSGEVDLAADGSFTYTPDLDFVGTDTFTYEATDGVTVSNLATVTVTVANQAPVAEDDGYATTRNVTLVVPAVDGVLDNDTDPDGDALTATLVDDVDDGVLTLAADGGFEYDPDGAFVGTDTFTYEATDSDATSDVTTVTITVGNDAPIAAPDGYEVLHGEVLTVGVAAGVLANDSDPDGDDLTAELVTDVSDGTLTLDADDGSFTYTPDPGFAGTDTFTYEASDGVATSAETTVTIDVTNEPPNAVADDYEVGHDTTLTRGSVAGVLANDTDPDGDALTASVVSGPSDGALTLNANGSFAYTPDPGFVGTDAFTYQAADGVGGTDTATVTITVTNDAPDAVADAYEVVHDTTLNRGVAVGVLANDSDPDDDALTVTVTADVADGTLTLNANGSFAYTPDAGFVGTDGFTYQAADGLGGTDVATVTITVTNDPPTAVDDPSYATPTDTQLVIAADGVLDNDNDPDGDALTASVVTDVANGTLTLNSNGGFTYDPDTGFTGTDTFTYQAADGVGGTDTATATITVGP